MTVVPANRRVVTLGVTLALLILLVMVGAFVRVPYVSLGPGPTLNTLGALDGKEVVSISGVPVRKTDGHLNLTTVSVTDGLTLFQAMGMWFSGRDALQPREEVYPPDKSTDQVRKADVAQFAGSEDAATIAALRYLKRPLKQALTVQVAADGPAEGILRDGDQLVRINGTDVTTPDQVKKVVSSLAPGSVLTVDVVRDNKPTTLRITLRARTDAKNSGYLGIGVARTDVNADPALTIDFNVGDIGGPSAGLMLTLGIIDKLGTQNLTDGRFIAGTGTIDDSGDVGEIGGITHKTRAAREAGATEFLVPSGNCAEARSDVPAGLTLVKVDTLSAAMSALSAIRDGKPVPRC